MYLKYPQMYEDGDNKRLHLVYSIVPTELVPKKLKK